MSFKKISMMVEEIPAWKICSECNGTGEICRKRRSTNNHSLIDQNILNIDCPACNGEGVSGMN